MNIFTADWDNQKKFQKISGFTMTLTHKVIHSFFLTEIILELLDMKLYKIEPQNVDANLSFPLQSEMV